MSTLKEIFHQAPKVSFGKEELVNINTLINLISNCLEFSLNSGILLPFYISGDGKRYELYQYELTINGFDEEEFEEFILRRTSKSKIEDIDKKSLELFSYCFIKIQSTKDDKKNFFKYIDFLKKDANLQRDIFELFGEFSSDNLYFDFY